MPIFEQTFTIPLATALTYFCSAFSTSGLTPPFNMPWRAMSCRLSKARYGLMALAP